MKFLGPLLGLNGPPDRVPRGFLGVELAQGDDGVTIKSLLSGSPADKAGLKAGDTIVRIGTTKIDLISDVMRQAAQLQSGGEFPLTVLRGGSKTKLTVTLGKGL
jgi:S1-C subfamily serine protease